MKVNIEIDILDDPEFCEKHPYGAGYKKCPQLDDDRSLCSAFVGENMHGTFLELHDKDTFIKCDACKKVYLKTWKGIFYV